MYINSVLCAFPNNQTLAKKVFAMLQKRDFEDINICICEVKTPTTLLNYKEIEWKMKARWQGLYGDSVHS